MWLLRCRTSGMSLAWERAGNVTVMAGKGRVAAGAGEEVAFFEAVA